MDIKKLSTALDCNQINIEKVKLQIVSVVEELENDELMIDELIHEVNKLIKYAEELVCDVEETNDVLSSEQNYFINKGSDSMECKYCGKKASYKATLPNGYTAYKCSDCICSSSMLVHDHLTWRYIGRLDECDNCSQGKYEKCVFLVGNKCCAIK